MSNVAILFREDMKRMFKNVVSTIITLGLVVVPCIFAWYNVLACWDVFDNTGNLKVAVASEDEGYKSDLVPISVNVGEQVLSALRANEDIDWVFTDAEDAVDGADSGRYYAAVVIPPAFSQDMLTFYSEGSEHASIVYYSNEKKSAIAPKITDKGADSVSYQVNKVFVETLSEIALGLAQGMSNYADDAQLSGALPALSAHMRSVSSSVSDTASVVGSYSKLMSTVQTLLSQTSSLAASAGGALEDGGASAESLAAARDELKRILAEADQAVSGIGDVGLLPGAGQPGADVSEALQDFKNQYEAELKPAMGALIDAMDSAALQASLDVDALRGAASDLQRAASAASSGVGGAAGRIAGIESDLRDSAAALSDLADRIDAAIASADVDALKEVVGSDVETLSAAISAPVGVNRIAVFPSESFGSSMAPLYTTLALFIGSLLIMVAMRTTVSQKALSKLKDPKPWETFLGRFCSVAFVSLLQSTLMGLGNIFFLQVQAVHPWLLMLCFWLAGLVFTFTIYTLVATFANLGKAIAVLMLIVQVTGCGGSFPLQIMPPFVQAVSPWLPATHVVDAMRAAMMGIYGNDFWVQMGELALFIMPAAIIGLALRVPLQKFMTWYIKRVEASKLIS